MLRFTCVCFVFQVIVAGAISRRAHADLPGQIVVSLDDRSHKPGTTLIVIDPNTGTWVRQQMIRTLGTSRVSPDGRTVAYLAEAGVIRLVDLRAPRKSRLLLDLNYDGSCMAIWDSDGRELIVCAANPKVAKWRVSMDGRKQQLLAIPNTHAVHDWSPDKKSVITVSSAKSSPFEAAKQAIYVMRLDGSQMRLLVGGGWFWSPRLSPDGKKVLYIHHTDGKSELWVVDFNGKNKKRIREDDGGAFPSFACWSPDGKHLAVQFVKRGRPIGQGRTWLEIMDAKGKNRRKIDPGDTFIVGAPDWQAKPAMSRKK